MRISKIIVDRDDQGKLIDISFLFANAKGATMPESFSVVEFQEDSTIRNMLELIVEAIQTAEAMTTVPSV